MMIQRGATLAILMSALLVICNPAFSTDPTIMPDRSFITVTGTVASTLAQKGRGFMLDYGDGTMTVEVDDWDWDDDSAGIFPGERVTVKGQIDKDLHESKSIEASSVYVHNRSTYYFASSADEEGGVTAHYTAYPADGSWVTFTGEVTSVSDSNRSFEIDTGFREFEVRTQKLTYNPLDKIGIQKISEGDRVSVTGELDRDFFDEDDILASSVISLSNGKKSIVKTTG